MIRLLMRLLRALHLDRTETKAQTAARLAAFDYKPQRVHADR